MAKEEGEGATEEAKGIAQTFLGVFGVVDIVLGGLALYALHVAHLNAASKFEGTGSDFADNALLVSASALAGKLVCLGANFLASVTGLLGPRLGVGGLRKLQTLVKEYQSLHPLESGADSDADAAEDRALTYLESERPPAAKRCALVRDNAIFAYGAALIILAMSFASSVWVMLPVSGLFVFLGFATYEDFLSNLHFALRAVVSAQQARKQRGASA